MRIAVAHLMQETNTFSPQLTDMAAFARRGVCTEAAVLEHAGERTGFAGFLDVVAVQDCVGIISVEAGPAGPLTSEAMASLHRQFCDALHAACPVEAVLLSLHGALAAECEPDVDGLFVETARTIAGPDAVIGVSLDMHANVTRRMVAHADVIRGYHTHPHLDQRNTCRATARLVTAAVCGQVRPVMRAVKIPMVVPAHVQISERPPMRRVVEALSRFERRNALGCASLFAVQPWLDVPELGWCSVCVADAGPGVALAEARTGAAAAWASRHDYLRPVPSCGKALRAALASSAKPIVISDLGDCTSGGATGDSTGFLRALLKLRPAEPCYVTVVDPEAARRMAAAGVGGSVSLRLGGKLDRANSHPVEITGEVRRVLPASPERELPEYMGLVAVLQAGCTSIVVSEHPGPGHDPVVYAGAGLAPSGAKIMQAKSMVDFRSGYRDVAHEFMLGEAPGLTASDLCSLPFEHIPRPLFPFDETGEWDASVAPVYAGADA